jgi:hypothetical protein
MEHGHRMQKRLYWTAANLDGYGVLFEARSSIVQRYIRRFDEIHWSDEIHVRKISNPLPEIDDLFSAVDKSGLVVYIQIRINRFRCQAWKQVNPFMQDTLGGEFNRDLDILKHSGVAKLFFTNVAWGHGE